MRDPTDPDRDRFVLSKGHAALALYAALAEIGVLSAERSRHVLRATPPCSAYIPSARSSGVDFSTGSLGQGLSMAVGAALARHDAGVVADGLSPFVSDAECNEGAIWEAAMFAAQHRLQNLAVLVDHNHQQAFGYTKDVLGESRLAARWRAFGWDVIEADGHDEARLVQTLTLASDRPSPRHRGRDGVRKGRLVHGTRNQVALPPDVRLGLRAGNE